MSRFVIAILGAALLWSGLGGAEPLTIQITKGVAKPLPIAVAPFAGGSAPVDIAAVIRGDLAGSGRFQIMATKDMPAIPADPAQIQFKDWKTLGQDSLVVGNIKASGDGFFQIDFRLLDVIKEGQIVGFSVRSNERNLRMNAHRIADLIFQKLTGIKGAFATRIAYVTVQKAGKDRTYRLDLADSDGYNPRTLIESAQPIMSPAWSPDGRRLAYVSFEEGSAAIYVQEILSGQRRKVATGAAGSTNSAPAWAPDGRGLAIARSVDGNPDIYLLDLTSGQTHRLTEDPGIDTEPTFAPDGKSIFFTSDRGGGPQIYRISTEGGKAARLTVNQGNYNAKASVSPDGKLVALVHGGNGGYRIAVLDLAAGKFTELTDSRLDESPSFAPNGVMILYATMGQRGTELSEIAADGRVQNRIEAVQGEVREPAWGPIIDSD